MPKDNPVTKNAAFIVGVIFSAGVLVGNASLTTVRSVRNSNDISMLKQSRAADDERQKGLIEDVKFIKEYIMTWEPDNGQAAKKDKEEADKESKT